MNMLVCILLEERQHEGRGCVSQLRAMAGNVIGQRRTLAIRCRTPSNSRPITGAETQIVARVHVVR